MTMADEQIIEPTPDGAPEVPPPAEPEDVVSKAELEALKSQNEALEKQLEMLRSTLMSPEYLNLLRGGAPSAPSAQPAQATPAPEPEVDFENMTPKQLADYVASLVRRELEPKVQDAVTKAELVKAQQEVQECAAKYPDFWMYRDAMYNIAQEFSRRGQSISAEEAYFLAKGRALTNVDRERQKKAPSAAKAPAPLKPVGGEKPSAGVAPGATTPTVAKSVQDAFEQAWRKFGMGG